MPQVGDKVEFYFGTERNTGVLKEIRNFGRCRIFDEDNLIWYDTDLTNVNKIVERAESEFDKYKRIVEIIKKMKIISQSQIMAAGICGIITGKEAMLLEELILNDEERN